MRQTFFPVLVLLASAGCATLRHEPGAGPRPFDAGPLASRTVEADGTVRLRALGPLFERVRGPGGSLDAVRPLYAREADATSGWVHHDIAWPIASAKSLDGSQASARFLTAYFQRFQPDNPKGRWRLWVLPVYFQGRDADGRRYAALFPLGGRIHEILGRDELAFVLFPLWSQSRVNEVKTTDILWPVFSRTEGKGIHRFRFFPFYGKVQHRGLYTKRFILWPFWSDAQYAYAGSQGSGFMLFPFYGRIRLTDQQSDLFLMPFFRVDRTERIRAVTAPWPFFRISRGETEEIAFWPLYRSRRRAGIKDGYLLWPLGWSERIDRGSTLIRRRRFVPFVHVETRTERRASDPDLPPAVLVRDVRIWPLLTARRDGVQSRWRFPAPWPTANPAPIERSWAPLWTLADVRRDGENRDVELLWGMFRHRVRTDGTRSASLFPLYEQERTAEGDRRWSVLKGLVGMRRHGAYTGIRFLYAFEWGRERGDTP